MFGSPNPKSGHVTSTLKIPQKISLSDDYNNDGEDGCPTIINGEEVSPLKNKIPSGNTVLLSLRVESGRFKCSSRTQVQNAMDAGASGVLFTNVFDNAIPRTIGYDHTRNPADIPACTITKETEAIFRGTGEPITIDWSNYVGWQVSLEPRAPHRETPVEILSPWELKWTYPAAMASFNPDEVAAVSGEVIIPEWHTSCKSFYTLATCQDCYNLASPFETPDDVLKGKIFLFIDYPACFENYHHYPYITQQHGGVATIMKNPNGDRLPASIGPYSVGIDLKVALYIMKQSQINFVYHVLEGRTKGDKNNAPEVHVSLPQITNGWGPNFSPHEDDLESIPDTTLRFTPQASGSKASSCDGGSYPAGQTTYNPDTMAEAPIVLAAGVVDQSCNLIASGQRAGEGVDCVTCLQKLSNGSVFTNDNDLNGMVVLIKANDIYCAHEFIDVSKAVQDVGGKGLILSMRDELTMTLIAGSGISQTLRDGITIPTYNIRKGHGDDLYTKLKTCNAAGGSIQAVLPKLEEGKASERTPHTVKSDIFTTEVIISGGNSRLVVDAGQALFNPKTSKKMTKPLSKIYLVRQCNAKISCQSCYLLDWPLRNRIGLQGAIAVFELESASCIRPVYNYVLYAQKLQASGVLFVTKGNRTITLGPTASDAVSITIPSFTISKRAFEDAGGNSLFYRGSITFPAIYEYVAPESTVQSKSEMVVNKNGDVPDTDTAPSIQNSKVVDKGVSPALIIGIVLAGIIVCCVVGKRVYLIYKRNTLVAFGSMTHEITTQTGGFSNIFEETDGNMFDNVANGKNFK
eukprot:g4781.t1